MTTKIMLGTIFFVYLISVSVIFAVEQQYATPIVVRNSSGKSIVAVVGSDINVTARKGQAYPLGSKFKTKKQSTIEIEVAYGTVCHLMEKTETSIVPASDGINRMVKLVSGNMLTDSYKDGPKVYIQTPAGICSISKGSFISTVTQSGQTSRTDIVIMKGIAEFNGNLFNIPKIESGTSFSITKSDNDLVLLVNKGFFTVMVPGQYDSMVARELTEGGMMMIGSIGDEGEEQTAYLVFMGANGTEESWEVISMATRETSKTKDITAIRLNLWDTMVEVPYEGQ